MKTIPLLVLVLLAWSPFGFAGSASQRVASASVWQQSQRTNTADAFSYSRFTLLGKFVTPSPDGVANRPTFVVDCIRADESPRHKGTFLAGNLLVGTTLKIIYVEPEEIRGTSYVPKVAVRYRPDNARNEEDQQWSPGSDKTSASIPEHALKALLRAHTVTITADDDHGRPVTMEFDMPEQTLVEQSCHVDVH
jgi:hypothetical protein